MYEDDRKIFWQAFTAEDDRRKINYKQLAKKLGRSPSALYKFRDKCAGGPNLLESISIEIFGRPWIDIVAEQNVRRNDGQKLDATVGGGRVWADADYVRSLEKRIDALQMLVEQHLRGHSDGPAGDLKKNRIG